MTFQTIINSINLKIENSTYERFTVAHVVDELNNTYRDLANKTDLFETVDYLQLVDDKITYTLPNRIYRPARAVYRGQMINFRSQEEMDTNILAWETHETESDLEYLVYNNLSTRQVMPYPRLTDVAVEYTISDIRYLGQLSDVSDTVNVYLYKNTVNGATYLASEPWGTISDLPLTEVVTIYGTYLPPLVVESDLASEDISISELQINALIYGTAGNLLFTSGRTEDIAKGQMYLKTYGLDETEVGAIRKKDFTGGFKNTSRNTAYRTPFNR